MKIKKNNYYVDSRGRVYGPLQFHRTQFSAGSDYYTAPGHNHRWNKRGKYIESNIFQQNPHPCDLVEEIELKRRKK